MSSDPDKDKNNGKFSEHYHSSVKGKKIKRETQSAYSKKQRYVPNVGDVEQSYNIVILHNGKFFRKGYETNAN